MLRAVIRWVRNFVEIIIPIASFILMFAAFIWQIFSRYVLNAPVQWAYEITVSGYLWMVVLGACYAQRSRSHVTFTLFYDALKVRGKAVVSFLGNLLILTAFLYAFLPSLDYIKFVALQKTSVLKIGLNIVYAPYVPFMVIIILYGLFDLYRDGRIILGLASKDEIKDMLQKNSSEVQEAIDEAVKEENQ